MATYSYNLPLMASYRTQWYNYYSGENYANYASSRESGVSYLPESRVKPAPPLWLHMTSRAKVHKLSQKIGHTVYEHDAGSWYRRYTDEYFEASTLGKLHRFENRALIPYGGNLRDQISDISANLSSTIAEHKKLADGFLQFAGNMRKIKRRILGRAPKGYKPRPGHSNPDRLTIDDVASTHLALHFGIKPLVQDLYGVYEKSASVFDLPPVVQVSSQSKEGENLGYSTYGAGEYFVQGSYSQTRRAKVYVRSKQQYGNIDIGNPAEWIWELIPFSFIIDWGIDIGGYISQLSALQNVDTMSSVCITTKEKWKGNVLRTPTSLPSSAIITENVPAAFEYESYQRDLDSSIALPEFPSFDPSIGLLRAQHATALLVSLTSGRRSRLAR